MQRHAAAILLALTLSVAASAQTTLAFHVELTDGRTALLANPRFHELKLSDEQLRRAANDRVLLLDQTAGTKWTWLMLSWLESKPSVEHGLNAAGTAAIGKNADVGLTPIDERTLQVRCLRERCELTASSAGAQKKTVTLAKDQTQRVAFASDIRVVILP